MESRSHTVALHGMPVRMFQAWEEQADALLREYVLVADSGRPFTPADVAAARLAALHVSALVEDAAARGEAVADIDVEVGGEIQDGTFAALQAVLDDATSLAQSGELLVLPSLPELAALRNWMCDEVQTQVGGGAASRWQLDAIGAMPDAPFAQWAGVADLPVDASWLVGDDHNRIIAAGPAALRLLGWAADDLIGQRILVVIPPHLREAHVAAFSHGAVTGEYRLLGQPLAVDAWTKDGRAVPITLTLERHSARAGRTVFVAWLEPVGPA